MVFILAYILYTTVCLSGSSRLNDARFPVLEPNNLCKVKGNQCVSERKRDSWNVMCFDTDCPGNQTVHCVINGEPDVKAYYYCAKPRMCDAGMTDKVYYNSTSKELLLTNTECPTQYYQPLPDYCNNTCRYRHHDTPAHVIIVLPGNSSHSAIGACNSTAGYFFPSAHHDQMYFRVDEYRDPCNSRLYSEQINCTEDEDICGNGTCMSPCNVRLTRDPCDCACKPSSNVTCSQQTNHRIIPSRDNVTVTTLTPNIQHVLTTDLLCIFLVSLVTIIICLVYLILRKRTCFQNINVNYHMRRGCTETTIHEAEAVHIGQTTEYEDELVDDSTALNEVEDSV